MIDLGIIKAVSLWGLPFLGAVLVSLRWRALGGWTGLFIQTLVTNYLFIVVMGITFGFAGLYAYWPLLFAHLLLFIVVLCVTYKWLVRRHWIIELATIKQGIPCDRATVIACTVLGCVSVIYGAITLSMLFQPPLQADCLWMILPLSVKWLQTGNIWTVAGIPFAFYPHTYDIVISFCMLPTNTDLFLNWVNLPAALLCYFALYRLARQTNVSVPISLFAAGCFMSMAGMMRFMWSQKPDILLVALFIVALGCLVEYRQMRNTGSLLYGMICVGLLTGVKPSGLLYGVLIGALAVLNGISVRPVKWGALLGGCAGAAILSCVWPFYNWIVWGNPLYPMPMKCAFVKFTSAGIGAFETGALFGSNFISNFNWRTLQWWPWAVYKTQGFANMLSFLAWPVISVVFIAFVRKRTEIGWLIFLAGWGALLIYMSLPGTVILAGQHILPTGQNIYYGWPFFAVALLSCAQAVNRAPNNVQYPLAFLVVMQLLMSFVYANDEYGKLRTFDLTIYSFVVIVLAVLVVLIKLVCSSRFRGLYLATGFVLCFIVYSLALKPLDHYRMNMRTKNSMYLASTGWSGEVLDYVNRHTGGESIDILWLDHNKSYKAYPLLGYRLDNRLDAYIRTIISSNNGANVILVGGINQCTPSKLYSMTKDLLESNLYHLDMQGSNEWVFRRITAGL